MDKSNLPSKQPRAQKPSKSKGNTQPLLRPVGKKRRKLWLPMLLAAVLATVLGLSVLGGALAGYRSGVNTRQADATQLASLSLKEQYDLAVEDLAAGRYEVARQRLDYILAIDPDYPGATDRLTEALAILYATATPSALPPTITPTPTRDPRPVQELFSQAQSLLLEQQWDQVIDTLLALRQADPTHQTARVDGMLFISLRERGVAKIWNQGNLEGGAYDLALAERFAPLDVQADSWRDLARLYLFGSSFWEVLPEQAVFYFAQVAAAAPNMRDSSGWTAAQRYRVALVQYGDQLAGDGQWCEAQQQYELSLTLGADAAVQQKRDDAALKCSPPTPTQAQVSETPSPTLPVGVTPTVTIPIFPTATNTQPPGEPTNTPAPPTATTAPPTEPPPPSETPAPPTTEPSPYPNP